MGTVTLLTGGARCGKSSRALDLADRYRTRVIVAVAEATDPEMVERIAVHRADRDENWITVEEPIDLAGALRLRIPNASPPESTVVVIDCLTVWLGNLFHHEPVPTAMDARIDDLVAAAASSRFDIIIVTNEIGWGIVPADAVTRRFRDVAGRLNQRMARIAARVEMLVCGVPMVIKGA